MAVLAWGGVHELPCLVIACLAAIAGALRLDPRRGLRVGLPALLLLVPVLVACLLLVPVPEGVRSLVQPSLVQLGGVSGWRPLAADPRAASLGAALAAGLAVFAVGLSVRPLRSGWLVGGVGLAGGVTLIWVCLSWGASWGPGFGPFRNPNHAGVLLAVGSTLWIGRAIIAPSPGRWAWIAGAVLLITGAIGTGSRSAMALTLGGAVLTAVFALRGPWRVRVGVVSSLVGLVTLATAPWWFRPWSEWLEVGSTSRGWAGGREAFVGEAVRALSLSPVAGLGPGGFAVVQPITKVTPDWARAAHVHLDPLEALLSFGLVGAVCGLMGLLLLIKRSRRWGGEMAGLAVIGLAAGIGFPLHVPAIAVLGTLLLARVAPLTRPGKLPALSLGLVLGPLLAAGLVVFMAPSTSIFGPSPSRDALAVASVQDCDALIGAHPLDGQVRFACGRRHGDREAVEAAVRLDPSHPFPRWALARVCRDHDEVSLAAEHFGAALTADLPPGTKVGSWLSEAVQDPRIAPQVISHLEAARPERLCAAVDLLPNPQSRVDALAARSARCALVLAERAHGRGELEKALTWLAPWPVDCGRQRLGAELALELERPAEALAWLRPAAGVCLAGDRELSALTDRARNAVGISPRPAPR